MLVIDSFLVPFNAFMTAFLLGDGDDVFLELHMFFSPEIPRSQFFGCQTQTLIICRHFKCSPL
ncbi:hypothetical protein DsansV1_C09g0091051 [Dioscorea sansibarensis]